MSGLTFRLFGSLEVTRHGFDGAALCMRPGAQALLAYLLLNRHRHHRREALADLFWGDHDSTSAKRCLSTTLWRLRCELDSTHATPTPYVTITTNGEIGFNLHSDFWLDVATFEEKARQGLRQPPSAMNTSEADALEAATHLYLGDLLEGIDADWALIERERMRMLYLKSLTQLMEYYQHQRVYEKSLDCGQKILAMDPLREDVHRVMIQLYVYNGQRTLAMRQYDLCRSVLAVELNIPPMPETEALYTQISAPTDLCPRPAPKVQANHPQPHTKPPAGETPSFSEKLNPDQTLQQLHIALQSLDILRSALEQLMKQIIERN